MDATLHSGAVGLGCNATSAIHVNGAKRVSAMFDVKADGVHHGNSAGHCGCDRRFVADIYIDRLKMGIAGVSSIGVSRRDPHGEAMVAQTANQPAPEETRTPENSDPPRPA
jgi:hypothetical protein